MSQIQKITNKPGGGKMSIVQTKNRGQSKSQARAIGILKKVCNIAGYIKTVNRDGTIFFQLDGKPVAYIYSEKLCIRFGDINKDVSLNAPRVVIPKEYKEYAETLVQDEITSEMTFEELRKIVGKSAHDDKKNPTLGEHLHAIDSMPTIIALGIFEILGSASSEFGQGKNEIHETIMDALNRRIK